MKKRFISFLSGMVVGAVMFGGSVAYASGILADLSNNQIFVDGTLTPSMKPQEARPSLLTPTIFRL